MITVTNNEFYINRTWDVALNKPLFANGSRWVRLFDQNGYRLTPIEQQYALVNGQSFVLHEDEKALRKDWMFFVVSNNTTTGPHLNHAFLFERKGYSGPALMELLQLAKKDNIYYKLVNYKGKWGVDFSIDYVDEEGNSMEILHFEYDAYNYEEIQEVKEKVEHTVTNIDWSDAAQIVLKRKDEWINLEFFEQSKWKTDLFGLPAERFKMAAWE